MESKGKDVSAPRRRLLRTSHKTTCNECLIVILGNRATYYQRHACHCPFQVGQPNSAPISRSGEFERQPKSRENKGEEPVPTSYILENNKWWTLPRIAAGLVRSTIR